MSMKTTGKPARLLTAMMNRLADFIGRPLVFIVVVVMLIAWFALKQVIEYDIWLDIMDISIFIVTFLLLFVIQASQNADTMAIQDKLDEIIKALPKAKNSKKGEEKVLKQGKQPAKR